MHMYMYTYVPFFVTEILHNYSIVRRFGDVATQQEECLGEGGREEGREEGRKGEI